jgi:AcrR family transcriptional regulator
MAVAPLLMSIMNAIFIIVAQYLKGDVRSLIENSALIVFSARGYEAATVAEIAKGAGIATGNIYLYFKSKRALFRAVMTRRPVADLERLIQESLSLSDRAPSSELLDLLVRQRLRVSILLGGAHGTEYEEFLSTVARGLVQLSTRGSRSDSARSRADGALRFALEQIHSGFLRSVGRMLGAYRHEDDIRAGVGACWAHHTAGLRALLEGC